ncbi:MAG: hypothetical protein WC528_00210 [Patescibacteria group bacterium]
MNYVIGGIAIIVGSLLVVKTEWFYNFTGPIDWAEAHLGSEGGTKIFIKLIGLIIIIGTFLALTGCLGGCISKIFKSTSSSLDQTTTISE